VSDATRSPADEPDPFESLDTSLETLRGYCRWCAQKLDLVTQRYYFADAEDFNRSIFGVCYECDRIGEAGPRA
jgi:hypothetical protein